MFVPSSDAPSMPLIETAAINAGRMVVGKALNPLSDVICGTWSATSNLGPTAATLKSALLHAETILDSVRGRDIHDGPLAEQLRKLRDLTYNAKDALDELEFFRIQDKLEGTHEADDRGCFRDLIRDTRHTTKAAVSKLTSCCASKTDPACDDPNRDAERGNGNKLVCGVCCPCKPPRKTAKKLQLNRVDLSKRMKRILDELQPLCDSVATTLNLLLGSIPMLRSAADRPKTAPVIENPELYGRDEEMKLILDGITHKFCEEKDLTIVPIVGHGGIGKTTFAQHVYQKAKSLSITPIWICVSSSYNVNNLIQEVKEKIPEVEGENKNTSDEELIQQRLKLRRFLLILDDIWNCQEDEWNMLLAPLRQGEARGNMVLVTTRFPDLVTKLRIAKHLIELKGLANEPFENYFFACVFGQQQQGAEHESFVNNIGRQIVNKLKGFPLAAKTLGRLLRDNLTEDYWRSVLESKEWERQTGDHDIMPALKLSYDYLPYQLQQCFAYCALFPQDYEFRTEELIQFWIGLEILHSSGQNKSAEDIGHEYLNGLVTKGFFNKFKNYSEDLYVIHDLLRDLALMIPSNECLSICYSNVNSVQVHPSVRHLSIIMIEDHCSDMTAEDFNRELRGLKNRLKVGNLQTLILFDRGRLERSFYYLSKEMNSLRVLFLDAVTYPVKSMLDNFSKLIHLRYLRLGSMQENRRDFQLPSTLFRLYHLRILNLKGCRNNLDFSGDMSNLVNLHYFLAPKGQHFEVSRVGKLEFLRRLEKFRVRREQGFHLKELEPLMAINKLCIYDLENVGMEETGEAILAYKRGLHELTLHWGSERNSVDHDVETHVLENLRPHGSLKELSIIGHRGYTWPTWLSGRDLSVTGLRSLHLDGVAWKDSTPNLWLQKLRNLESLMVENCKNLSSLPPIPWTHTLCHVSIMNVGSILHLSYSNDTDLSEMEMRIEGSGLRLDDKVLDFDKLTEKLQGLIISGCLPLAEQHLRKLTSLKRFSLKNLDAVLLPSANDGGDIEWQLPVEQLWVQDCSVSGNNLTRLLYHFPVLSYLQICRCKNIKRVGMILAEEEQTLRTTPSASATNKLENVQLQQNQLQEKIEEDEEIIAAEELPEEKGLLVLPPNLCSSLQTLYILDCADVILVQQGGLRGLCSLVSLFIKGCPNFLSAYATSSSCPFPPSLKELHLKGILGMEAVGPRGEGLWPFLIQGHVTKLQVIDSPNFFAGCQTSWEQNRKICSCMLQDLFTDDAAGLSTTPVCSLLSSSLTKLTVNDSGVDTFSEGQGNAFELLTSLQELIFVGCTNLLFLPPGLDRLPKLEEMYIFSCPQLSTLSQSRIPRSLQVLNVRFSSNEMLKAVCCIQLKRIIPNLML